MEAFKLLDTGTFIVTSRPVLSVDTEFLVRIKSHLIETLKMDPDLDPIGNSLMIASLIMEINDIESELIQRN
jgi:hypothetical protein